jgi:hypothetical protein
MIAPFCFLLALPSDRRMPLPSERVRRKIVSLTIGLFDGQDWVCTSKTGGKLQRSFKMR